MKFKFLILTAAYLFFVSSAEGADLNFSKTFYDLQIKQGGTVGRAVFERTYNSEVKQKGLFGIGWCSNLESTLFFTDNCIYYSECGFGEEETFSRTKNRNLFISKKNPLRKITYEQNHYVLKNQDKLKMKFSYEGRLVQEIRDTGEIINLEYGTNQLIKSINLVPGGTINFTYTFERIRVRTQLYDLEYSLNNGNLVQITENSKVTHKYDYATNGKLKAFIDNGQISNVETLKKRMPSSITKANVQVNKGIDGLVEEIKKNDVSTKYFWRDNKIIKILEITNSEKKQKTTEFSYNSAGLIALAKISESNFPEKIIKYKYDDKSRLVQVIIDSQLIKISRLSSNLQLVKISSNKEQYNFLSPDADSNSTELLNRYEAALLTLTKTEVSY
ncbi:MAG: DUF6531 domain-containing protein [Pseudobdellovibrio sp.]